MSKPMLLVYPSFAPGKDFDLALTQTRGGHFLMPQTRRTCTLC